MPTAVEACTHERRRAAVDIVDWRGDVVAHFREYCIACWHAFPEEEDAD